MMCEKFLPKPEGPLRSIFLLVLARAEALAKIEETLKLLDEELVSGGASSALRADV